MQVRPEILIEVGNYRKWVDCSLGEYYCYDVIDRFLEILEYGSDYKSYQDISVIEYRNFGDIECYDLGELIYLADLIEEYGKLYYKILENCNNNYNKTIEVLIENYCGIYDRDILEKVSDIYYIECDGNFHVFIK